MNFELFKFKVDSVISDKEDIAEMWKDYYHNSRYSLDEKWKIYQYLDWGSVLKPNMYASCIRISLDLVIDFCDIDYWERNSALSPVDIYKSLMDVFDIDENTARKAILDNYWNVGVIIYDW